MSNQIKNQPNTQYDDEIDLREIFATLWAGKWIITGITTGFAVVAVVVALMLPNQYKSTAVLAPAQSGSSAMMAGLASQFGGLASLAGIDIGGGKSDESQIAMEIMKSWGFVDKFIRVHGIEVEVFAATKWMHDTNELVIDEGLYDTEQNKWVRNPPFGKTVEPTSWELYKEFKERLNISQAQDTGLISVSFEYYSPQLSKLWVDAYIELINNHMRERRLEQVNRNIEYLRSQIEKTSIVEMKEVFYQIIEEQTKSKMLAEASPEYAFVTVSEAMVVEEKSAPNRVAICMFLAVLGAFMGVIIVMLRKYLREDVTDRVGSEK